MSRRSRKRAASKQQTIQVTQPQPAMFPAPQANYNTQVNANVSFNQHNSGFPSAAEMQALSIMVPDICERFVRMAELEQQHELSKQNKIFEATRSERKRSQILGTWVVTFALMTAGFCAYVGAVTAAAAIGTTTVLGLASAFILNRNRDGVKQKATAPNPTTRR